MKKLFRFISGVILAATLAPLALHAEDTVTLYGVRRYNFSGGSNGLYSIEAKEDAQPEIYWYDGDMLGNGGAVYADGSLYVLSFYDYYGEIHWGYQVCNVDNRTYDYRYPEGLDLITNVAACLTYDPSTDVVYAVCLGDDTGTNFDLCTMDTEIGSKTHLFRLERRIFTLASTAEGQIYGVGDDGVLYKINKYDGTMTEVGDTGLIPNADQTAVIDYKTNVMYWAAYTEEGGGLYTTDIETGETTLLSFFEDGWQFTGLFIKQTAQNPLAPLAVEGLKAVFDGASLAGNLEFKLPSKNTSGDKLTENVKYSVYLDGVELASGNGTPGAKVSAPVSVSEAGTYRFVVTTKNGENGEIRGASTNITLWVGMDTPRAVTNCNISVEGDEVTTTWTLPERGIHNGYVDHSAVRYKIIRGPEDILITPDYDGTIFTESVPREGVYPVMYSITPFIGDLVGEAVITDWKLVGDNFVPPCIIDFTDPFNSLVVEIFDANNDRASWYWDDRAEAMACMWPISNDRQRDDWLITAPIYLNENEIYDITAVVASEGKWNYPEQKYDDIFAGELGVFIGREPNAGAMTTKLIDYEIVESIDYEFREASYEAHETGLYYVGLHVIGGIESGNIYNTLLRSISVIQNTTGIEDVNSDASDFSAFAIDGGIAITNPSGVNVTVVTLDGRTVADTSEVSATLSL
ncbi:MAG: hypothetical protein K2J10_02525, partial [Muribaculaceae bacterium]|nr:hypothetical protein [Muribaculaceae bacterium]